jgi:UrcA family protein
MPKTLIAAASFAALMMPAMAAPLTIDAMTPTLGGGMVAKRLVLTVDSLSPADAAGAAALYDKINAAAVKLCTSNPGGQSLLLADEAEKCRAKAVKAVVKTIDSDALTAVAASK